MSRLALSLHSMALPPALTPAQRQAALEKAAEVRKQRAEIKGRLKGGSLTLDAVLAQASTDEAIGKMRVVSVLESLPGIGKVKAKKLMASIGISESRRLQGLGVNQREALLKVTTKS